MAFRKIRDCSMRKLFLYGLASALLAMQTHAATNSMFELRAVDEETGRGVPMVEFRAVNHKLFITDSAGRVALNEPGWIDRSVFFHVRSHGYEMPKDGFGYAGTRVKITSGGRATVKLKRRNIAERMYRVTGEGIYRDSVLLGHPAPINEPLLNAEVVGQDSVQPILYKDRIYWFWGDTSWINYPLGNFRTTGATSPLPGLGGTDPAQGVNLDYFKRENGFTREMCPFEEKEGIIWLDGVFTVPGESGEPVMLAHYERLKGLGNFLEHGICRWNDDKEHFEKIKRLEPDDKWRAPHGQPLKVDGYVHFGGALPNVRAPLNLERILEPGSYEAWTCLADGSSTDPKTAKLHRDPSGNVAYRWTKNAPPIDSRLEKELIDSGRLPRELAHGSPIDVETGKPVVLHRATVKWNEWRKRWIMIVCEIGGTSMLGEIWYAEAHHPAGPFRKARKVVTHEQYSFYNPVHHDFFDQDGGQTIFFEGTYTADFSGNKHPTPRYDYNQIMYKLDLADERLKAAWVD